MGQGHGELAPQACRANLGKIGIRQGYFCAVFFGWQRPEISGDITAFCAKVPTES